MKKLMACCLLFGGLTAHAYWTPIDLSLFTPAELPWCSDAVYGLRVDVIYGRTSSFCGLDIGIANHVRGDAAGIQVGECNFVTGRLDGLQVAAANFVRYEFNGVQVGYFNRSYQEGNGVQIGVMNMADDFCGVQVGLVNIIRDSSLAFSPIVNVRF